MCVMFFCLQYKNNKKDLYVADSSPRQKLTLLMLDDLGSGNEFHTLWMQLGFFELVNVVVI